MALDRIDLNADLGESFGAWRLGDDDAMLDVVTSANVACGFHAGDPLTLARTCAAAAARDVVIGAQVGYRDLAGFGRRHIQMARDELAADVLYQLGALSAMARAAGREVRYVKPHGALYHAAGADEEQAGAVVDAVTAFDPSLPVLTMPGSRLAERAGVAGIPVVAEGFADRGYRADGTLVPRGTPGAVLTDPDEAAEQAVRLAGEGVVGSICVHGDTPGAVVMSRAVRAALRAAGIALSPFA